MSLDDRDWYRDALRKKTAYTERADFRVPVESWYNPKLFRRDRGPTAPPAHSLRPPGASWLSIVVFWLLVTGLLFGAFKFHQHYKALRLQAQVSAIDAKYWRQQAEEAQRQLANVKAQRLDFFKR